MEGAAERTKLELAGLPSLPAFLEQLREDTRRSQERVGGVSSCPPPFQRAHGVGASTDGMCTLQTPGGLS